MLSSIFENSVNGNFSSATIVAGNKIIGMYVCWTIAVGTEIIKYTYSASVLITHDTNHHQKNSNKNTNK